MSTIPAVPNQRPFTADAGKLTKTRPLSSQCPTILKHHISPNNATDFTDLLSPKMTIDRPKTATSSKKITFPSYLGNRNVPSASTFRPTSAGFNSSVNFDFINAISKDKFPGKFDDKSGIQPLKRIKTEQFHTIIYKVKEQKEMLESKIEKLERWQKEINSVDVWNTPQSAIIDSILKLSAENNPDGSANDFLRRERERQKQEKLRKKSLRPGAGISSVSVARAKSVEDFFKHDEIGIGTIHQIIASPMNRMIKLDYMTQKSEISEKITHFYENVENYRNLVEQSKEVIASRQTTRKDMTQTESNISVNTEVKSISAKAIRNTTEGEKILPQVHIDVNHDYRPGNLEAMSLHTKSTKASLHSPSGVLVIHTRPSTAKSKNQASNPTLLTSQLADLKNRDYSEEILNSPIYLQGSKMVFKNTNSSFEKKNRTMDTPKDTPKMDNSITGMAEKVAMLKTDTTHMSTGTLGAIYKGRPMTAQTRKYEPRPMSGRDPGSKRMQSAKTTIATQTFGDGNTKVKKIDIDGIYFDNYSNQDIVSASEKNSGGKNVLRSWVGNQAGNMKSEQSDFGGRTFDDM